MALLPILTFPDPRLHKVAAPVAQVDATIRRIVDDMLETMYDSEGIGLAATQVDIHQRIIVMDTSEQHDSPLVLINPEITARSDEVVMGEEGCLSVPTVYDRVARHAQVTVRALNREGDLFEMEAQGVSAVCVQHEMDHLMGKVFVEYLSALKRDRIRTKLLKRARDAQRA